MRKKMLSVVLALCLLLDLAPVARAASVTASGAVGCVSWSLAEDGTLTISGNGAIPDYNKSDEASPTINDRPWAKYRNSVRKLVVREGITRVGSRAFQSFEHLESVVLADSVKTIGVWAFQNCFALSEVTLPDSVCLDTGAFRDTPAFELPAPKDSGAASTDAIRVTVNVNGSEVQWTDAVPFIDANGRTMVPLRAVGDALGLSVGWSDEAREASFTDGAKAIYFPIGSTEARAGLMGTVPMDTAAVIIDGRTYAPVRYLAEYFGYSVEWDGMSNTVVIKKP